jgi:hypothetical protein
MLEASIARDRSPLRSRERIAMTGQMRQRFIYWVVPVPDLLTPTNVDFAGSVSKSLGHDF